MPQFGPEEGLFLGVTDIANLWVCDDPAGYNGFTCFMTLIFRGGENLRIGLKPEALRTLMHALIDNKPPIARTIGEN